MGTTLDIPFLGHPIEKEYPGTTCIYAYKAKIPYYGSLDKLNLRIVEIGDYVILCALGDDLGSS